MNFKKLFLLCVVGAVSLSSASIDLYKYPSYIYSQFTPIPMAWTGGQGPVHLRCTRTPSGMNIVAYDSVHTSPWAASDSIELIYAQDVPPQYQPYDLREGANYCILTDKVQTTREFIITYSLNIAPRLSAPTNGDTIQDLTPVFRWTGQSPYYSIMVSDRPFRINDDKTVENANVIWRYTTDKQSVYYGERDADVGDEPPPPLLGGRLYYWLVANTYDKTSNAVSEVVSNVFSFVYDVPAPAPPQILAPGNGDTLNDASGSILFRWQPTAGAVTYRVYLMEQNLINGSDGRIAVWDKVTPETFAILEDPSGILRNLNYFWRVFAYDAQGAAVESIERSFYYNVPASKMIVRVRDSLSNEFVPVASVSFRRIPGEYHAFNAQGVTELTGYIAFENLPHRTYELIASKDGYQSRSRTFNLISDTTITLNIPPLGSRVYGQVTNINTGFPISEALMRFYSIDFPDQLPSDVRSNVSGGYSIGLMPGRWRLETSHPSYNSPIARQLELSIQDSVQSQNFTLAPKAFSLSGIISNSFTQGPLNEASLILEQNGESRSAISRGDGSYLFQVNPGDVVLRIAKSGFRSETFFLTLLGNTNRNFSLEPGASTISGLVRDQNQNLLPGVTLKAISANQQITGQTDLKGEYTLSLPAGDWSLTASKTGYSSQQAHQFTLGEGRELSLHFNMEVITSLVQGRVTALSAEGQLAIQGATVTSAEDGYTTTTDASGRFNHLFAQGGTHTLRASKSGYSFPDPVIVSINPGDTLKNILIQGSANAAVVSGVTQSPQGIMPGVEIQIQTSSGIIRATSVSDERGLYSISVAAGEYTLIGLRSGYLSDTSTLSANPGAIIQNKTITLQSNTANLSGQVLSGGQLLGTSGCVLHYTSGNTSGQTPVSNQGYYQVALEAGRTWNLQTLCNLYEPPPPLSLSLVAGNSYQQNFIMTPANISLKGRTYKSNGTLGIVRLRIAKNGAFITEKSSDSLGNWSVGLSAGDYSIEYAKDHYQTKNRILNLNSLNPDTLRDTLNAIPKSTLWGYAKDNLGSFLAGARVRLIRLDQAGEFSMLTPMGGRYSFNDLPAGNYKIEFSLTGLKPFDTQLQLSSGSNIRSDGILTRNSSVLAGTVQSNNTPIAGAMISISSPYLSLSVFTDALGHYSQGDLSEGIYSISAFKSGYATPVALSGINLGQNDTLNTQNFSLTPLNSQLTLQPSGIANTADIRFRLQDTLSKSDYYGSLINPWQYNLSPGVYRIYLLNPGYRITTGGTVVANSGSQNHIVNLTEAVVNLSGTIRNQDNATVSGLSMSVRDTDGNTYPNVTVNNSTFTLNNLQVGKTYRLRCLSETITCIEKSILVSQDATGTISFSHNVVDISTVISGTLALNNSGVRSNLSQYAVQLSGAGNGNKTTYTNGNGQFSFTGIQGNKTDSITLNAVHPEGSVTKNIKVNAGASSLSNTLDIIPVRFTLADTLRNQNGVAIANARVLLTYASVIDTLTTNSSGRYSKSNLNPWITYTISTLLNTADFDNLILTRTATDKSLQGQTLTITEHSAGLQLSGVASVQILLGDSVLSGSNDNRIFSSLVPGNYRLTAFRSGYSLSPSDTLITLNNRQQTQLSINQTQLSGALQGIIYGKGYHDDQVRSLGGSQVTLEGQSNIFTLNANGDGSWSFNNLTAGDYTLRIRVNGHNTKTKTVTLSSGVLNTLDTLTADPRSLIGRLQNDKGSFLATQAITLIAGNAAPVFRTTDANGRFYFGGLSAQQQVKISVSNDSISLKDTIITIPASKAFFLSGTLKQWASISGLVEDTTNTSLSGVDLKLRPSGFGLTLNSTSQTGGLFSLSGLNPGDWYLSGTKSGYSQVGGEILIRIRGTEKISGQILKMKPLLSGISGTVTGQGGLPLSADVKLVRISDTLSKIAEAGGSFLFSGLNAGTYTLRLSHRGYITKDTSITWSSGLENINLQLTPIQGHLGGVIYDALRNTPISNAIIRAQIGASNLADTTNSDGEFVFSTGSNLADSTITITQISASGYATLGNREVQLNSLGSADQNFLLVPQQTSDGQISVTLSYGNTALSGTNMQLQSDNPLFAPKSSTQNPGVFTALKVPDIYTLVGNSPSYGEIRATISLDSNNKSLDTTLSWPSGEYEVLVFNVNNKRSSALVYLNDVQMNTDISGAGKYQASGLEADSYHSAVSYLNQEYLNVEPYDFSLNSGELRQDSLWFPFEILRFPDTLLNISLDIAKLLMLPEAWPYNPLCTLFIRNTEDLTWTPVPLGFAEDTLFGRTPLLDKGGTWLSRTRCEVPNGLRGRSNTSGTTYHQSDLYYGGSAAQDTFVVRDPVRMEGIQWFPGRLASSNSLLPLNSRAIFSVSIVGSGGRRLDSLWDAIATDLDSLEISWYFADTALARSSGLSLLRDGKSRSITLLSSSQQTSSPIELRVRVAWGSRQYEISLFIEVRDLQVVRIGIRYDLTGQKLSAKSLLGTLLSNRAPLGHSFSAFAIASDSSEFTIYPTWSLEKDSLSGSLQEGLFYPDTLVVGSDRLIITDTLNVISSANDSAFQQPISFETAIQTYYELLPDTGGVATFGDGNGLWVRIPKKGLAIPATMTFNDISLGKSIQVLEKTEVAGNIYDIILFPNQPFVLDSGAYLSLPAEDWMLKGDRSLYLAHWSTSDLSWEIVDSIVTDSSVGGKAVRFSPYAIMLESDPLGAYGFEIMPNPFTPNDPWALQLQYRLSSQQSTRVQVQIQVFNMVGDLVYESRKVSLAKNEQIQAGTHKQGDNPMDNRKAELAPYLWDGRTTEGKLCRNGRYILKLIVKDRQKTKTYLKKVVLLK
jgi:hypothetical protein